MSEFNVTLSEDAVRYFIATVLAGGVRYTVEDVHTGETVEVDL